MSGRDHDPFLNPLCTPESIELHTVRQSILRALIAELAHFEGTILDVGCGQSPYKPLFLSSKTRVTQYLGLDLANNPTHNNAPDLLWDGSVIPLPDQSVDWAVATEVLEHCPDPTRVLEEILRVLRPGGGLFLTVPFLWPLHEVPFDEYRYTPFSLRRLLVAAGFVDIKLSALGGWDLSLAQMLGLWVSNRVKGRHARRPMRYLTCCLIKFLSARDRPPDEFTNHTMISGLAGTAHRPRGSMDHSAESSHERTP